MRSRSKSTCQKKKNYLFIYLFKGDQLLALTSDTFSFVDSCLNLTLRTKKKNFQHDFHFTLNYCCFLSAYSLRGCNIICVVQIYSHAIQNDVLMAWRFCCSQSKNYCGSDIFNFFQHCVNCH